MKNPDFLLVMEDLVSEFQTALLSTGDEEAEKREHWFRKFRACEDILNFVQSKSDEKKRVEHGG